MKNVILSTAFMLLGTFTLANNKENVGTNNQEEATVIVMLTPSICEVSANAARNAAVAEGLDDESAGIIYDATLTACEKKLAEEPSYSLE